MESPYILHLKRKYIHAKWDTQTIKNLMVDLQKEPKFKRLWRVNIEQLTSSIKNLFPTDFQTICTHIALSFTSPFPKKDIQLIGDKNPVYSWYIPEILQIFPSAKFVFLIRDYHDNIYSHINRTSTLHKSIRAHAHQWLAFNTAIMQALRNSPEQVLFVRYEDLIQSPQKELKKICSFLKLAYSDELLNYQQYAPALQERLGPLMSIHKGITQTIDPKSIQKSREFWNEEQLQLMESICGSLGDQLNYDRWSNAKQATPKLIKNTAYSNLSMWWLRNCYNWPFGVRVLVQKTVAWIIPPTWAKQMSNNE